MAPILFAAGALTDVSPGLIIWTLITFTLLLLLLRWKAWGPILATIEAREQRIRDSLESASRQQAEAETVMAEHQAAMEAARKDSAELVRAAQADMDKAREAQLEKARQEAANLVATARRQIEEEKKKAIAEVKSVAVDLAIQAAGKLIEAQMDEEGQRKLVEEYLASLPSA